MDIASYEDRSDPESLCKERTEKTMPLFEEWEPELTIENVLNKVSKLVYVVGYI